MSLRGRYVIDRIKKAVGHHFQMPVPPYGEPEYWDAAYRSFGPQDCYEWGDVTLEEDLMEYEYRPLDWDTAKAPAFAGRHPPISLKSTLGDALHVHPNAAQDEPLLMLGCGNSKLGEDMVGAGWRGPIVQVDVSTRVVESMAQRCHSLIQEGHMNCVQDDATELSAFHNGVMHACLDKGLMDAVYCADEYKQCGSILKSVHRVLKPGGVFVFFSFSRPEFFLPKVLLAEDSRRTQKGLWEHVQVQELSQIMLYKFQKKEITQEVRLRRKGGKASQPTKAKAKPSRS